MLAPLRIDARDKSGVCLHFNSINEPYSLNLKKQTTERYWNILRKFFAEKMSKWLNEIWIKIENYLPAMWIQTEIG